MKVHGGWHGPEPECERIQCGFPGYIRNGLVNGSSTAYAYGDTVKYNCTRGFRLSGKGNASRICQENGQWSGDPPECLAVTCDAPNSPANGSFSLVKNKQFENQLQPPISSSAVDSSSEDYITTGSIGTFGYAVGDRIQFTCLTGFRLDGPSSLNCLDEGQWEDVMPICQPLACTQPPYVENGIIVTQMGGGGGGGGDGQATGFTPGFVLTFACQFGYQLESTGQVQCDHEGFWVGKTPKCLAIRCGSAPQVANALVILSSPSSSPSSSSSSSSSSSDPIVDRVGSTATYSCQPGYEPFGPAELECTERGVWMDRNQRPSIPVCMLVDCGPLPLVDNGSVYAEDQTYGSVARLTCYDQYKPIAPVAINNKGGAPLLMQAALNHRIECGADKLWSGAQLVKCAQITCTEPPPSIRNGSFLPADNVFAAGESVTYICEQGFQLSVQDDDDEASHFVCTETGTWIASGGGGSGVPPPQCLPMPCPTGPGEIEFGSWNYTSAGSAGSPEGGDNETIFFTGAEVMYWCDDGYYLAGDPRRRCSGSAGWMPSSLPVCRLGVARRSDNSAVLLSSSLSSTLSSVTTCPPLENPEHGSILIDGFTVNETATYECDTGFQPAAQSPSQLICNADGNWTFIVDAADESVSVSSNDSSHSSVPINEQGQVEETTPPLFRCEPVFCGDPQAPINGSVRFTSLSFGSKAIFSCDKGFVLNGSQVNNSFHIH